VIDTSTNTVAATVGAGANPSRVAVSPDGTRAYVTNSGSSNVSVIATASNTAGSNNVSVIATATNTVVATVTVGLKPIGIAVAPGGNHAYVTNANSNNVSVIATATNTVMATVGGGEPPH